MKKRLLLFMLAVVSMATNVGWVQAEDITPEANTLAALRTAIAKAKAGDVVRLTGDIKDANAEDFALTIANCITLDGDEYTISGKAGKNIIAIMDWEGGDNTVTVRDLTITNSHSVGDDKGNGLIVYQLTAGKEAVLENVQLINNTGAGMVINASTVEANRLFATGNGWGSINLEGADGSAPELTLNYSRLNDKFQIWADYPDRGIWFVADGWRAKSFTEKEIVKTQWVNALSAEGTFAAKDVSVLSTLLGYANEKNSELVKKITLPGASYALTSALTISNPITLEGVFDEEAIKTTISGGLSNNLIHIDGVKAGEVVLNNLIVTNKTAAGIVADSTAKVKLNHVELTGNADAGLVVNASTVEAANLNTSGNFVGVRLQRVKHAKQTTCPVPHFKFISGKLGDEAVKIAYSVEALSAPITVVQMAALVDGDSIKNYVRTYDKATLVNGGAEAIVPVWTNRELEKVYVSSTVSYDLDKNISGLDSLLVDKGFATVRGVVSLSDVAGLFPVGKEAPKGATLKTGLIIATNDAYLVTGTGDIKATNKPVRRLTISKEGKYVVSADGAPVISGAVAWNDVKYKDQNVTITSTGFLTINTAMTLDTVFMEEGAQLKVLDNTTVAAKAVQVAYNVTGKWKAYGFPFANGITVRNGKNDKSTDVKTTAGEFGKSGIGLWTAIVKSGEGKFDLTAVNSTPGLVGLIAVARDGSKQDSTIYVTTTAGNVSLATKTEKDAPIGQSPTFEMCANPNLFAMKILKEAYVLGADGNFNLQYQPTIAPFQSYILADATTTSTLRSLKVGGDITTGNEAISPIDGYYVVAGKGTITIHTAEPVRVVVTDMSGRIFYNASVTSDGYQIAVPAGVYAVNKQKVIVK